MSKKFLVQGILFAFAFIITYNTYHLQKNTCDQGKPLFQGAVCGDSDYGKVGGFPLRYIKDDVANSVIDSIYPIEDTTNWELFFGDVIIYWVLLQPVLLLLKKCKNKYDSR